MAVWRSALVATLVLFFSAAPAWPSHEARATGATEPAIRLVLRYPTTPPPAVPAIPGTTRLRLPLYPRSQVTSRRFLHGLQLPMPATPYVRVAMSRHYEAPDALVAVEAWYKRAMAHMGYTVNSCGTSENVRTAGAETILGFSPQGSLATEITITFGPLGAHKTQYALWATNVVMPTRPRSSDVPVNLRKITGTVTTNGTSVITRRVTIANPHAMMRLARAINGLTTLWPEGHCPAITKTASLQFFPVSGRSIHVSIGSGCVVRVGSVSLEDFSGAGVWSALMKAIRSEERSGPDSHVKQISYAG